jgi:CobQ-like glutamine amidotransferase family enzyme
VADRPAKLRVCALYPDLMNIYADRGNLLLLERRCRWRGIDFSLSASGLGDELDPEAADLYYIGGGQDRDQRLCALDLAEVKREALHAIAGRGGVILAVCGGYQLLGHSYQLGPETLPGAGLVDLHTVRAEGPRLIGNVAIEVELEAGARRVLAGFENHGGRTHLGPRSRALGRVLKGHGNNGRDGREGVRAGNVIGTYLHGPLLPKNAWFADWLIATALGIELPLAPLNDELEAAAHADARRAAGI